MITTKTKIKTAHCDKKLEDLLKSNNIVYPMIEELNQPKYFFDTSSTYLQHPFKLVSVEKYQYVGKNKCVALELESGAHYIVSEYQYFYYYTDVSIEWKPITKLRRCDRLFGMIGRTSNVEVIKNIKYVGVKPTWNICYDADYFLLENGLLTKNYGLSKLYNR
jgi:hypothetical protein